MNSLSDDERQAILARKLAQLYPEPRERQQVDALLATYGSEGDQREPLRVRLAVIKLAGADFALLTHYVEVACQDYRDVLAWAEYPEQMRCHDLAQPREQREQQIAADLAQYREWLNQ